MRVPSGGNPQQIVKFLPVSAETCSMTQVRRTCPGLVTVAVATALSISGLGLLPAAAHASSSTSAPRVAPSGLVYTVKNGDYLSGIARKLGVQLADLLVVNDMDITAVIYPGSTLIVPAGGTLPAESGAAVAAAPAPRGAVRRQERRLPQAHRRLARSHPAAIAGDERLRGLDAASIPATRSSCRRAARSPPHRRRPRLRPQPRTRRRTPSRRATTSSASRPRTA